MHNNIQNQLNNMIKSITDLTLCSNKNCIEARNKLLENKIIYEKFLKASLELDADKKEKLLNEVYKNKQVIEYNACVFKHCKKMYINLFNIFDSLIKIAPFPKDKKDKLKEILDKVKPILKSSNLTNSQITKIIKNFTIIQTILRAK